MFAHNNRFRGFSLIEVMIALVVGLLVLMVCIQVFLSSKQTYRIQDGLARLQENARFATFILAKEARMAGYLGCSNPDLIVPNVVSQNPPEDAVFAADQVINGSRWDAGSETWLPSLPTNLQGLVANESDTLTIRRISQNTIKLKNPMQNPNNPLVVENGRLGIEAGDIVMVTDCTVADVFTAGANGNASAITHTVANNTTNDFSKAYTTEAIVAELISTHYYIQDTGRVTSTGQPVMGLFSMDMNGTEQEIAEGVERMRILYGVDSDGDGIVDTYAGANTVESNNWWPQVLSAQIRLLFNTVDEVNMEPMSYRFDGTTTTPNDRMLRREIVMYVTFRNRVL